MRLTTFLCVLVASPALLVACGGASPPATTAAATPATTSTAVPALAERAKLFEYDESAPLAFKVKKKAEKGGVEVDDVSFKAADRTVTAYLVRPKGKPHGPSSGRIGSARSRTPTALNSFRMQRISPRTESSRSSRSSSSHGRRR